MAVRPHPSSEIPENAQRFAGSNLGEALTAAAKGLEVGGISEVEFGFNSQHYSLGAEEVEILAWTRPFPSELVDARNFVREVLGHLGDSSSIGGSIEADGEGRPTRVLMVNGPSSNSSAGSQRARAALRRVAREGFGWDIDLRFQQSGGGGHNKEDRLRDEVRFLADKARKTGEPQRLRPMNSYERRLAHNLVKDVRGVTTRSVGDGRNRQVEIVPED